MTNSRRRGTGYSKDEEWQRIQSLFHVTSLEEENVDNMDGEIEGKPAACNVHEQAGQCGQSREVIRCAHDGEE